MKRFSALRLPTRLAALFALAVTALPLPGYAADATLSIVDAYVREAPPNAPASAAFMLIRNTGTADRRLTRADSPAAASVELHNHVNDNGVMRMRQVPAIDIKAGGQTELKPGSYHIMLIGPRQPLKAGEHVSLTLSFDDGSTQTVDAPVRAPIAGGTMPMHGHSHGAMPQ